MRVLWFTNTASLGAKNLGIHSTGGGWLQSLEAIIAEEVQLSICFYHKKKHPPFTSGNTTYYPIKPKHESFTGKILKRLFRRIEQESDIDQFMHIIEMVKPDIIHIHGTEGPFGLIQQKTKIPTLVSIQGIVTVCSQKYFSGISKNAILSSTPIIDRVLRRGKIDQFISFQKTAKREQIIFENTKNLTGRTDWDRRVSSIMSPEAKYFHLNEILRDGFYSSTWNPPHTSNVVLFSTLGADLYKGLETVLMTANLLDKLSISYKWKIAGIAQHDKIVRLTVNSTSTHVSQNVLFLGTLTEKKLISELVNANLYIGTSHIENSPNSLCEAMLLGMPVIGTYAGGTSSIVNHGENGILVQDGDPYVLAGTILELIRDSDKSKLMAENARKKALIRHEKQAIKDALKSIYQIISKDTVL